jgi:glycosyltransferase involved in cell wall biosynthesis
VLDKIKARKVFIPCGFSCLHEPSYAQYFADLPNVLRKLDHLIFYSEKYRDIDFVRAHGIEKFSVLPNGASELEFDGQADPHARAQLGIAEGEFVFLSVGSPISMKGHAQVAEAFARLETNGRPATLILNGDWPPASGFTERAAKLSGPFGPMIRKISSSFASSVKVLRDEGWAGVFGRVKGRLRGPVAEPKRRPLEDWVEQASAQPGKRVLCTDLPRLELVQVFRAADLFVFASLVEYSPLVLYEAAAAGVAFLSVPVGNAEEIARWTGGGIICPAPRDERGYVRVDPGVLAGEMLRCMDAPEMLAQLGRSARERWRRQFTWQAIAPHYEAILSGCTSAMGQSLCCAPSEMVAQTVT